MINKKSPKALAIAMGATFVASLAAAPVVSADQNPFAMKPLSSGYQIAGKEGQCGEGKCGGAKKGKDAHCGGKKGKDAHCGGKKDKKDGNCGGMKKDKKEGSCGGMK